MNDLISRQDAFEVFGYETQSGTFDDGVQYVLERREKKMKIEATFNECHKNNLCVDCDNTRCWHCGNIEADCPKWECDFDYDCGKCAFIKKFQESERKRYAKMKGD